MSFQKKRYATYNIANNEVFHNIGNNSGTFEIHAPCFRHLINIVVNGIVSPVEQILLLAVTGKGVVYMIDLSFIFPACI